MLLQLSAFFSLEFGHELDERVDTLFGEGVVD
jgi:hypothetical protein